MRLTAPKGTNDILPARTGEWDAVERLFLRLASVYGYREIRTPIFERTELFARGIGDATDIVQKEMFTFTDRGGRSLTLRPEITAGAVRAYLEHNLTDEGPVAKMSYLGPAFRQERPQAGRYQQFEQYGVECFGSRDPALDAEVIDLAVSFVRKAGLSGTRLLLNSIGCPTCRRVYRTVLIEDLGERRGELCPTCRERLERNPLRVLDCKSPECQAVLAETPVMIDYLCPSCTEHFQAVQDYLADLGIQFELAPGLVRGLDYYTNTVFELLAPGLGAQNTVLGGGRYDGLIETCGGPPTPGVGFAGGIERLLLALAEAGGNPASPSAKGFFVAPLGDAAKKAAVAIAHELRAAGLTADIDYLGRSLKAQLREAGRQGAQAAIILGGDELARQAAAVKWLNGREQEEKPLAGLADYLAARAEKDQGA